MQHYSINTNEIYEDYEGPMYSESSEPIDVLSNTRCTSAVRIFHPTVDDCSMILMEEAVAAFQSNERGSLSKKNESLMTDDGDEMSMQQWKFDDLTPWMWLQNAIHPESLSRRIKPSNGLNLKKWVKEKKQRRKEEDRLQKAEAHAAVSIAGLAAALAAIAAENAEASETASLTETAVASAPALVAAHCGQVAEAVGAKREQLVSALNAAMASTDANDIITLTAAAVTCILLILSFFSNTACLFGQASGASSLHQEAKVGEQKVNSFCCCALRGAQTLRGRSGRGTRIKWSAPSFVYNELDFNFGRCRASLAKGDEILVATPDGKCRLRSVSAILNKDGKIVLKIKKASMLTAFSSKTKSIIYDVHTSPPETPHTEEDASYFIEITTNKGKIQLKVPNYVLYKKWVTNMNHMLMLSKTFTKYET